MLDVLEIIFPIYALIALGFVVTWRGVFSTEDLRAMGRYIVNLAMPALIFTAIADRPVAETVQLPYILVYGLGTLTMMAIFYSALRRLGGYDHTTATLATMGSTCPNSGFVGYPILLLAMPEIAKPVFAQNVIVETVLFIPLMFTMLEFGDGGTDAGWHRIARVARRIATGPLFIGMATGMAVSLSGWHLPQALDSPVHLLAVSSGAISLVVIGGTLAKLRPNGVRVLAGLIVAGKLVLHPLFMALSIAALLATGLFDLSVQMRAALVLTGAIPIMSMFPLLAQAHGREGFASAAQFGSTIGSLFTLSALLLVLT